MVSLAYIERPCLKDEKGELAQEGKASDLSLSPERELVTVNCPSDPPTYFIGCSEGSS